MLARWYLLLGQFSVTFEYRPGSQHAHADGMSRQCGQCQRPDCPVSATDSPVPDNNLETEMVDRRINGCGPTSSMGSHSSMGGLSWALCAIALLALTNRKFVH